MVVTDYAFEFEPYEIPPDETAINLRAYLDRVPDEKLAAYRPTMTDGEMIDWDGNFKDDETLFLVCCDRDVDAEEFRAALESCIAYRKRVRA